MTPHNIESNLSFESSGLLPQLLKVVQELGFVQMTPIQAAAVPLLLVGKDVIGQSQTGSGKTAAFVLPILQRLDLEQKQIQAVVLLPTRELVMQVVSEIRKLGRGLPGLQVLSLAGGQPSREQAAALAAGVHVVVGTPGRVLDHGMRGRFDFSCLATVVLDEADKMLDMGFELEIKAILDELPKKRQTALFSATFLDSILNISSRYQKNPVQIKIAAEPVGAAASSPLNQSLSHSSSQSSLQPQPQHQPQIEQYVYECEADDRVNTLMRVLQQHPSSRTVIFCNQKATVNEVGEILNLSQVSAAILHGDLEQRERDRVLALFRNGSHQILVATDVAARGLDIENLELVINLDFPQQPEVHVHRIGRTGRAGRTGTAVTLARPHSEVKIQELEKVSGSKMIRKALGFKNQHGLSRSFAQDLGVALMTTISISGGRKDKLRPGDILGALTAASKDGARPAQDLKNDSIGKIEIHDRFSYVAVNSQVAQQALEKLRDGRIKGSKYQVRFVK